MFDISAIFLGGGGGMLLISTELQLPGNFAASLTTESHLRLRGLALHMQVGNSVVVAGKLITF